MTRILGSSRSAIVASRRVRRSDPRRRDPRSRHPPRAPHRPERPLAAPPPRHRRKLRCVKARARRNVTVTIANRNPTMPRPRLGALPMTAAERQARRRAKLRRLGDTLTRAPMPRGLPRPRRWAAAVTALMALQDEYRAWLDRLPESLAGSKTADKLQAITELDLDELLAIEPPRGYGRDRRTRPVGGHCAVHCPLG